MSTLLAKMGLSRTDGLDYGDRFIGAHPLGRKRERRQICAGLEPDVRPEPEEPGLVSTLPCDDLGSFKLPRQGRRRRVWRQSEGHWSLNPGQLRESRSSAAHSDDPLNVAWIQQPEVHVRQPRRR